MPNKLSVKEIIQKIKNNECFSASSIDNSFHIKIENYVPHIGAAIHDGSGFRDDLKKQTVLSSYDRWYEEDPHTADFISALPIVIKGLDSRFEYDLNRPPEEAVYDTAWGKQVWKKPLTIAQKQKSLKKHTTFYKVIDALVKTIEKKFGACIVYDIHSYNYVRIEREVPVFNIGLENVDLNKYGEIAKKFTSELSKITLPNINNTTKVNDVFFGRGYFLKHITNKHKNTLVLATEVKKIYCDELDGKDFTKVIDALQLGFKKALVNTTLFFVKLFIKTKIESKAELLSHDLDSNIIKIDKQLYNILKDFELLYFVNPKNTEQEKRKFFKSNFKYNPIFTYPQLHINPIELRRKLSNINVEIIQDVNIQNMFAKVISSYIDKIELLSSIGTINFLNNSIRYFGKPSQKDVDNANFLLYCKPVQEAEEKDITSKQAVPYFEEANKKYGFECKIGFSDKIASKAIVLNSKKTVLLKKGAKFSEKGLRALIHHEIGVHMVTTMNSNLQPLKIFNIGLPVNTRTQEGLAILSEYKSGNLTINRLKELALRVIAVDSLVNGNTFAQTFHIITHDYGMKEEEAFYLTTRIYRGGGFTKDYLYLSGVRDIIQAVNKGTDLTNLLIGKTRLIFLPTINEMVARGLIVKPKYITDAISNPAQPDPTFEYLLNCLK